MRYLYKILFLLQLFIYPGQTGTISAQQPYVGTTMGFADYLEDRCGIVYKENGVPKDPYRSLADHGATIIRLRIDHPPFSSSYSEGELVDHKSKEKVKISFQRAQNAGLKAILTFGYHSWALEDSQQLNPYVAPLAWQEIASDINKLKDSIYTFTLNVLDEFCSEGLIPEIVSIGNESHWHFLMPNVTEAELPEYDPERSVILHNAGSKAVRDIATKYQTDIQVCFHMEKPSSIKWWLETHTKYDPDFDIMGISLYHAWNNNNYAGYESLGDFINGMIYTYDIDLLVIETAQLFRTGGNDNHVDILGTENIPAGYPDPPTTETQKQYLMDLTTEVITHGGIGVIVWGGEWVGCDCYIYADPWGKGSSWENKAFWDFNYSLHEGVDWMSAFGKKISVTFKVDMSGIDVSNGVYVTGDFPNAEGETWKFNPMTPENNDVYTYSTEMEVGDAGAYFFLNNNDMGARETVPAECVEYYGLDRGYNIPAGSDEVTYAYIWSSCEAIQTVPVAEAVAMNTPDLIEISPNPPVDRQLNFISHVDGLLRITIHDLQGRSLIERKITCRTGTHHFINITSVRKGMYLVGIRADQTGRQETIMILIKE